MNASEVLLAELLEIDGWSCRPGYRVHLTKPEKVSLGQPSLPTPEIDVLAIKHGRVAWVESKTYIDSKGVQASTLSEGFSGPGRVKVFNDPNFRDVVTRALLKQLAAQGAVNPDTPPSVEYWFAAWKFYNPASQAAAERLFECHPNWTLLGPTWLRGQLGKLAETSYRDSTAALVAKLLLR